MRMLAAQLRRSAPSNVTVVESDILRLDLAAVLHGHAAGRPIRVAGNLPYNISSPILFRLIRLFRAGGGISDATVMLQFEVAERLAARPGSRDYGVLSILASLWADIDADPGPATRRVSARAESPLGGGSPSVPSAPRGHTRCGQLRGAGESPLFAAPQDAVERLEALCGKAGTGRGHDTAAGGNRWPASSRDSGPRGTRPMARAMPSVAAGRVVL